MESLTFVYYDDRGIPRRGRELTRNQLASIGVHADKEHVINIAEEYCTTCKTRECQYVETATDHLANVFS